MRAGETKQKQFKVEVPFEMRMGLIILKVRVNGVDGEFLLDSGAPNVIDLAFADKLGLASSAKRKATDSQGGSSNLGFTGVQSINIGGIDFLNTGTAIADLNGSPEVRCMRVNGLIGANLMRKAIWKIDYAKQVITICSSRDSLGIPAGAQSLAFTQEVTGTPKVEINYNGVADKNVTFDLGSSGDFCSSTAVFKQLKQQGKVSKTTYSYGQSSSGLYGVGKPDTAFFAVVPKLQMGGIALENQIVKFTLGTARTVGTSFFKHYDLVMDWNKNEVVFINRSVYDNLNEKTLGYGLVFRNGELLIGNVSNGNTTLQLGNKVLSINGKDYRTCSPDAWCEILYENTSKKQPMELVVLKDGKEIKVTATRESLFPNR